MSGNSQAVYLLKVVKCCERAVELASVLSADCASQQQTTGQSHQEAAHYLVNQSHFTPHQGMLQWQAAASSITHPAAALGTMKWCIGGLFMTVFPFTLFPMSCPSLPTALGDLCSICPDKVCLDWLTANGIVELVIAFVPNQIVNFTHLSLHWTLLNTWSER